MKLSLQQSDHFFIDLTRGVDWYRDHAGSEIAGRFVDAVEATLAGLVRTPAQGRLRFKDWPELAGIRSFRVQRPYGRWLIFYRFANSSIYAERLIHGTRDLPRRLRQSPQ